MAKDELQAFYGMTARGNFIIADLDACNSPDWCLPRDMSNRHSQIRLYIEADLAPDAVCDLSADHAHYLHTVMRKSVGAQLAVFNGRDGCYLGEITELSRKKARIRCLSLQEEQWYSPDLWLLFAPVKKARLDFMAQKATELGVSVIWPVRTDYCQVKAIKDERLLANAIEAAEQTERLDLPEIKEFTSLKEVLENWPQERVIIFCDERLAGDHDGEALRILGQNKIDKAAILVGPEGGFSMAEKQMITNLPHVISISLGPRILRADTAALSALTLYQAIQGDWSAPVTS